MKLKSISLILWLLAGTMAAPAQYTLDAAQTGVQLKRHISTLASDRFEGREAGKPGEQRAFEYLIREFRLAGMIPKGTEGYLQPFTFTDKTEMGDGCALQVNGRKLEPGKDFFPLIYSANGTAKGKTLNAGYGMIAPPVDRDDYRGLESKGRVVVIEWAAPENADPHSRLAEFADIRTRIDTAAGRGAAAVLVINTDDESDDPRKVYRNKVTPSDVPVLFVSEPEAVKALGKGAHVKLSSELKKVSATGNNVIGFIDKQAPATVVIGAHYDHLGYGHSGSLYRGEPAIHNGADDNASGTAALIELGRTLLSEKDGPNYLFIAFSGEEKGLLGSNYFVKHPTIDLATVNYMMNMDMVGRLDSADRTLQLMGTGTSPAWEEIISSVNIDSVEIKRTESGVGPSDHTSFYLKDIPVLHFFTGSHPDYHKPTDDEDKINYDGQVSVMRIMLDIIRQANSRGGLAFTKTKDSDNKAVPRFKVTLGVVPDYAFDGEGMRIDGVSDGKPASKAGLKAGDVVVQLGRYGVKDMFSYMEALSKFKAGDETIVKVKRGEEVVETGITF